MIYQGLLFLIITAISEFFWIFAMRILWFYTHISLGENLIFARYGGIIIVFVVFLIFLTLNLIPKNRKFLNRFYDIDSFRKKSFKEDIATALNNIDSRNPGFKRKKIRFYATSNNAYALGRNVILISPYPFLTEKDYKPYLEGLIAHEMGHLYYRDSILTMVGFVNTKLLNGIAKSAHIGLEIGRKIMRFNIIVFFVFLFFTWPILILLYFVQLFCSLTIKILSPLYNVLNRQMEYRADRFAAKLGCGEDLKKLLFVQHKFSGGFENSPLEDALVTHNNNYPTLYKRIKRIHDYMEKNKTKTPSFKLEKFIIDILNVFVIFIFAIVFVQGINFTKPFINFVVGDETQFSIVKIHGHKYWEGNNATVNGPHLNSIQKLGVKLMQYEQNKNSKN